MIFAGEEQIGLAVVPGLEYKMTGNVHDPAGRVELIFHCLLGELAVEQNGARQYSVRPVDKQIGWHSSRHGTSNLLRQRGVDVKIAQDLLRRANPRITMEIYQQTITLERREAQALVFDELWARENTHSPRLSRNRTLSNPRKERKEEVK